MKIIDTNNTNTKTEKGLILANVKIVSLQEILKTTVKPKYMGLIRAVVLVLVLKRTNIKN